MDSERVPAVTILLLIDIGRSNHHYPFVYATGTRQS
jgi:hypothetical protein